MVTNTQIRAQLATGMFHSLSSTLQVQVVKVLFRCVGVMNQKFTLSLKLSHEFYLRIKIQFTRQRKNTRKGVSFSPTLLINPGPECRSRIPCVLSPVIGVLVAREDKVRRLQSIHLVVVQINLIVLINLNHRHLTAPPGLVGRYVKIRKIGNIGVT